MRIVLDVTSVARDIRGGIQTYGRELVRGLFRVAPQHEYVLAVRSQRWFDRKHLADLLPDARPRLLLDGLLRLSLGSPVDVLHSVGVRLPAGGRFPKVVMMHDLNVFEFPELSKPGWRERRQQRIRQTVERADRLIAYSGQGADALVHYLDVPRERIRVVPLGVDTAVYRRPSDEELLRVRRAHDLGTGPYVLSMGLYGKRKNQHGLLAAFAAAELPEPWTLVLAGPREDKAQALRDHAAELGLPDHRLLLPGWVPDENVPGLLAGCGFYVCASLHEGFGLPVIEAQACGAPVAASNRAALLETLGDCGLSFDPEDIDDFAGVLRRLASDPALRADLAARGPARVAEHYHWDRVAERTLAVFAELV